MKKVLVGILILVVGIVIMAKKPGNPPGQEVNPGVEESADPVPADSSLGGKRAYVIIPSGYKDLYVIGMDLDGRKYGYGLSEDEEDEIAALNDININAKEYYDDLKILEISTEATEDIKLVVGYKILNKDKYVLLSSEDIDETKLTENYKDGDTLRIIDLKDYTGYSEFPGYEADEAEVMTGIRVGVEEMDTMGRIDPSNIIKKFDTTSGRGSGGVNIHPSNDSKEFMMISEDEKVRGEYIVWVFKKGPKNPKHYVQINNENDLEGKNISKVILTTVANINEQYLKVDGKLLTLEKKTTYTFEGSLNASMKHDENGASGWYFYILNGNPVVSPNPSEKELEEVYVIGSEGLHYEGKVQMTSGEENFRRRESNIEINVLGNEGIEIKSINE